MRKRRRKSELYEGLLRRGSRGGSLIFLEKWCVCMGGGHRGGRGTGGPGGKRTD